jgi:hypothetical protein
MNKYLDNLTDNDRANWHRCLMHNHHECVGTAHPAHLQFEFVEYEYLMNCSRTRLESIDQPMLL